MRRLLDLQRAKALVAADAVIQVNHQIARRQGRGLGQEVRRPPLALRPRQAVAQNVGLRDDGQVVGHEAVLDRQHRAQIDPLGRHLHVVPVAHRHDVRQAVIAQHGGQTLGRTFGPGGEQNALALRLQRLGVLGHGGEQVDAVLRPFGGEAAAQTAARVLARTGGQRRQTSHGAARQRAVPVAIVQIEPRGRQGAIGGPALAARRLLARLIGVDGQVPALCARLFRLAVEEDRRRGRQIVEQRIQPVVEEGQPVLDALTARALADGGVHRLVAGRAEQV